jgi:hypothetical protein
MIFRKFFFAFVLVVFVLCFSRSELFAKDEWLKVQSKNFQLVGNASEKDIQRVATKLEQFREAFRQLFPQAKFDSPIPTNVIVFKSDESFADFKPVDASGKRSDWVAGYFQSGDEVNYIALSIEGDEQETYRTIFHEYVHFLTDNQFGQSNIPPWFDEGLAEYYEMFSIEDDRKITLGAIDDDNLQLLRENKLIPFDTFFNTDYYTLDEQGDDGVGLYYAQAWALMHYLKLGNNGARNAQLSKFINLLLSGKQPKTAFGEAFQTDYATIEKELKNYIEQRSFRVEVVTLKNKLSFDAEMKTSPLAEADTESILGDLLYHTDRFNQAETLLKNALTLNPNSSSANITLGLVKRGKKILRMRKNVSKRRFGLTIKIIWRTTNTLLF